MDDRWRPTPLEVAGGAVVGAVGERPAALPAGAVPMESPSQALEAALLAALQRAPCIVAFSGGRDSSLVLAAAVSAARRHGLPEPIAVTRRFPDCPETEESSWQELVVSHVKLAEWVKLDYPDGLDVIGPVAAEGLRRHGVLFPALIHTWGPVRAMAAGGALVTGDGGDDWLGERRIGPLCYLVERRGRISRRHLGRVAAGMQPNIVRRNRMARSLLRSDEYSWMRPEPRAEFIRLVVDEDASEPLRWDRSIAWLGSRRGWRCGAESRALVGRDLGVLQVDVLQHPRFVAALQRAGGALGYPGRSALLHRVFGHLLPPEIVRRWDKALFDRAHLREHSRAFARDWDGSGLDPDLVDPQRLRDLWLSGAPPAQTILALQSAWLHQSSSTSTAREPSPPLPLSPSRP